MKVQQGTLASLAPTQLFDTIIYIDVLEHIEDDKAELRAALLHLNVLAGKSSCSVLRKHFSILNSTARLATIAVTRGGRFAHAVPKARACSKFTPWIPSGS